MKKLAIFDFDGTIMDSVHDVVILLNKALAMYDFPTLTSDEYVKYLGGNIDEIVALVLEDNYTPENVKMVKDTYLDKYYSSPKENTIPFPKSVSTCWIRLSGTSLIGYWNNTFPTIRKI